MLVGRPGQTSRRHHALLTIFQGSPTAAAVSCIIMAVAAPLCRELWERKKVRTRKASPDYYPCLGPCLLSLWVGVLALLRTLTIFSLRVYPGFYIKF